MLLRLLLLSVLCVTLINCDDDGEWREVRTAQGAVRGRKDPGGGLYAFYNIPYATVPKGADRFKAPLPGPVWLQPLDAVDKGISCIHTLPEALSSIYIDKINMQEDCLIANVFVPDTQEKNLPVIVSVHGGGFEIGYGNMVPPKYLVKTKKVIVVNFNYRLGPHGFLCLGTEDVPGNAGLKDQVALLRWVKENIANFGGNADDVTITGGSAGSISVELLMLSKSTEGLFNKVIPESGVDVASISVQLDPLENAKAYGKMLNFTDVDDFYALQDFFINVPIESLFMSTFFERKDASLILAPCIERPTGGEMILDDYPVNIIKKGKYTKRPVLYGNSNMEGLSQMPKFETYKNAMNEKFSDFIPVDLQFKNEAEKEQVAKKVKEFYFGDKPVGEDTVLSFIDFFSDVVFGYPTVRSVRLHVEAGHDQIYLYEYSFVDDNTPVVPFTNVRGATHCAQTAAIYDGVPFVTLDESGLTDELKEMKNKMRDMWYNFAVHGKPVLEGASLPAWPAARSNASPYMSLGKVIQLDGVYLEKRARFWEDIYQKHYRHPVPPPQPPKRRTEL